MKTATARVIPLREAARKVKREVPAQPVVHRHPPAYLEASRARARAVAEELCRHFKVKAGGEVILEAILLFALDDARSAGFQAGVAFGRGLGRGRR